MNKQVSHIGIAALVLLSALIVGTTYWQTWANAGLANRQDNDIRLVAQFSIKRGKIYASDGRTLLATNVKKKVAGQTLYFRRYPSGPLFSDVVGYSTQTRNRTGLEQSYNDYLTGSNANLDTVFHSALDKLKEKTEQISGIFDPKTKEQLKWGILDLVEQQKQFQKQTRKEIGVIEPLWVRKLLESQVLVERRMSLEKRLNELKAKMAEKKP